MNKKEWTAIAQKMIAWWPHNRVPVSSLEAWHEELADLDANHVAAAVKALCADGREHMPNWAQIRNSALDLALDAPDWSEVVKEISRISGLMPHRYDNPDVKDAKKQRAMSKLNPLIAGWIEATGWKHIAICNLEDRVAYAQLRDTWTAYLQRAKTDVRLASVPDVGLPRIQRAHESVSAGPRKLDALTAIGQEAA